MTPQEFKEIRQRLDLSQKELGEIMGMKQPAIARLESGGQGITKIHEAFLRHLEEMRTPFNYGDLTCIRLALLQYRNEATTQEAGNIDSALEKIESMLKGCGYLIV